MDEIQLKLLKQLQDNPNMSQRRLSKELDVSLGKINYCLKALAEKGWVKMESFVHSDRKAGYLYVLTPKGIRQKATLTVNFLRRKEAEYENLSKEIAQLRDEIRNVDEGIEETIFRTDPKQQ